VRFADKERHQLFIEPESAHLDTAYLQGFSSSMPIDVQDQMIRSLPGLAHVRVIKYAYAIEYDAIDPTHLKPTLELKAIPHLYCAGQINGTSGYEEAASQGLMASINAVNQIKGLPPFILRRDEAYIGVMIDDLVTKGTKEPYRLLTSRAEFRLLLRHDNADLRLLPYGHQLGLISTEQYDTFLAKKAAIQSLIEMCRTKRFTPKDPITEILQDAGYEPLSSGISALEIIRRPGIELVDLLPFITTDSFSDEVIEQVEIQIKYEGYLVKQEKEVKDSLKFEMQLIPEHINYLDVPNLATEARQKLIKIRPLTIGQASRISGVNPADINMLLLYLKMQSRPSGASHV
jgi:tRNA uridine 5-carboxymethylaminomethyl modification enzyme